MRKHENVDKHKRKNWHFAIHIQPCSYFTRRDRHLIMSHLLYSAQIHLYTKQCHALLTACISSCYLNIKYKFPHWALKYAQNLVNSIMIPLLLLRYTKMKVSVEELVIFMYHICL